MKCGERILLYACTTLERIGRSYGSAGGIDTGIAALESTVVASMLPVAVGVSVTEWTVRKLART
jgi:hypothetical protein